jgi:hypothetical protein
MAPTMPLTINNHHTITPCFATSLVDIKGKRNFIPGLINYHAIRMYGEWSYSSIILELGIRWRRVVSFTPLPLYPGERARGTDFTGGWVGPRAGLGVMEKKNLLPLN